MVEDPTLQKLRALKPRFKEMGIERLRVFGSRLSGSAAPDSDLDLLVEFEKRPDLFELGELYTYFEEVPGCSVDISQPHLLIPEFKERILKEARDV